MDIYLTNSLTRKKEKFIPITEKSVGMYTCGPTVYDHATIGNFRTYTLADILYRTLLFNGYTVKYIMNLTDVGHLTGDNQGDASIGEDRLEKSAVKEGKSAWDIAKYYTDSFLSDFGKLNLSLPEKFVKATDHINEQIDLIKKIEEKGYTYKTKDGVYFDTLEFEAKTGKVYGELSTLDKIKEGARVETNFEKRNPRDFALWKFSPLDSKRQMEWDSPWGVGFPGWHIECSAMSMKYLGESFDIHLGGEDLRSTHHPNEIAQSEAVTGTKFVNVWLHGTFLLVDGKRMGKSMGNAYTISDIEKRGINPLALRYLYLTANYKDTLNFTWQSLEASQNALTKLFNYKFSVAKEKEIRNMLSSEKMEKVDEYKDKFKEAINNDLDTPQALSVVWEMLKSNIPAGDKYDLLLLFDEVLGFGLNKHSQFPAGTQDIPEDIKKLINKREDLRKQGKFSEADDVRKKIEDLGFKIEDTAGGARVVK